MSVTRFGVSLLNVVATIESPASHQGTARPEAKNSEVLCPARLPKNSAGTKQIRRRDDDDDPVDELKVHVRAPHGRAPQRQRPKGGGERRAGHYYIRPSEGAERMRSKSMKPRSPSVCARRTRRRSPTSTPSDPRVSLPSPAGSRIRTQVPLLEAPVTNASSQLAKLVVCVGRLTLLARGLQQALGDEVREAPVGRRRVRVVPGREPPVRGWLSLRGRRERFEPRAGPPLW